MHDSGDAVAGQTCQQPKVLDRPASSPKCGESIYTAAQAVHYMLLDRHTYSALQPTQSKMGQAYLGLPIMVFGLAGSLPLSQRSLAMSRAAWLQGPLFWYLPEEAKSSLKRPSACCLKKHRGCLKAKGWLLEYGLENISSTFILFFERCFCVTQAVEDK